MFNSAWAQNHYNQQNQHNTHQQTNNDQQNPNDDFLAHQNMDHLKHDVKDQYYVDIDDKTNSKELDYYNFKLHDYDNNMLLDGLELLMALNHDHDAHNTENKAATTAEPTDGQRQHQQQGKFDQDALLVDHILTVYDTDKDGYISFYEYMTVKEHNKWN